MIPLLCTELFSQVEERSLSKAISVKCAILEIYNERLRDLLVPEKDAATTGGDLQIRDDGAASEGGRGIFVEGATEVLVRSCEEVMSLIVKAQARRAVGTTQMNEHSSRSHSVVTFRIFCGDVDDKEGLSMTVSKLHLIDLAGSERQKATGASGDRLKEGAQINLSLSALGNVINALTDNKTGTTAKRHVPYRDSKLTRLLQDSLGGNSYTAMICNVSPARTSVEETLSSLRFAERAKKIENKAIVNRDPKSAMIADLLQQNKVMRAKIDRLEAHIARLEAHYE